MICVCTTYALVTSKFPIECSGLGVSKLLLRVRGKTSISEERIQYRHMLSCQVIGRTTAALESSTFAFFHDPRSVI
jgi:hypothetical protein